MAAGLMVVEKKRRRNEMVGELIDSRSLTFMKVIYYEEERKVGMTLLDICNILCMYKANG